MTYLEHLFEIKRRMIQRILENDQTAEEKMKTIEKVNNLSEQELLEYVFNAINITDSEFDVIIGNLQLEEFPW